MSANKEDTLRQFCDVTGADEESSKFFLESANWQLEIALSSFYEHGGNVEEATASGPYASLSNTDMDVQPTSPVKSKEKDKKKPTNTKFATLDSLQQESSSEEDEASNSKYGWIPNRLRTVVQEFFRNEASCSKSVKKPSEPSKSSNDSESLESDIIEEITMLRKEIERLLYENSMLRKEISRLKNKTDNGAGQAFYAGGSERSGQQILGPGKGRKDIVTEMFKSVRERGAVVFEDEPSSASRGRSGHFSGAGYRLGQTADDHEQVTPSNSGQSAQESSRSVRLQLYREGFTVDSGPLRRYTDPENAEFLQYIRRGEIPPSLGGGAGTEVRVCLEDRRHEECPRSQHKPQAFTGKGQMLGSPTPPVAGATAPAGPVDREANLRAAQDALRLDDGQPVTTIQFRLADGSRLTGRFNHTHTVGQLAEYVSRAEPAYQLQSFALLTSYPTTELSDPSLTIAQANLLNSTLLQRLK